MEENKIIMEKLDQQAKRQDDMRGQLDKDRADIEQIRIDMSNIKNGQEAILQQMVDFKSQVRNEIRNAIALELPKIVKREIRLLSVSNPRKTVKGRIGILEWLKTLLISIRHGK